MAAVRRAVTRCSREAAPGRLPTLSSPRRIHIALQRCCMGAHALRPRIAPGRAVWRDDQGVVGDRGVEDLADRVVAALEADQRAGVQREAHVIAYGAPDDVESLHAWRGPQREQYALLLGGREALRLERREHLPGRLPAPTLRSASGRPR